MRKSYFEKYKCTFCQEKAVKYICSAGYIRKYIICPKEDCSKKAYFKLKYGTNTIKGINSDKVN